MSPGMETTDDTDDDSVCGGLGVYIHASASRDAGSHDMPYMLNTIPLSPLLT